MEAESSCEASLNICQTARHNIPKDGYLHMKASFFWVLMPCALAYTKVSEIRTLSIFKPENGDSVTYFAPKL
jgi:hypothetical protein